MNPNTIREMEPRIKQRFLFATSAFSRIYGVGKITQDMFDFCLRWAYTEEQAPLDCLQKVDIYFRQLWDISQRGF